MLSVSITQTNTAVNSDENRYTLFYMQLEKIRSITYKEIWEQWKKDEEGLWETHYQNEGFSDWESWRGKQEINAFLKNNSWNLYRVLDPPKTAQAFFVGPYKGWRSYYTDMNHSRFKDIVKHPGYIGSHTQEKVKAILSAFPETIQVIGARGGGEIGILEGTHRCCALAEIALHNLSQSADTTIALADISKQEWDAIQHKKKDLPLN
jgi:hypothetical protein